jgi:hypothetical protein
LAEISATLRSILLGCCRRPSLVGFLSLEMEMHALTDDSTISRFSVDLCGRFASNWIHRLQNHISHQYLDNSVGSPIVNILKENVTATSTINIMSTRCITALRCSSCGIWEESRFRHHEPRILCTICFIFLLLLCTYIRCCMRGMLAKSNSLV